MPQTPWQICGGGNEENFTVTMKIQLLVIGFQKHKRIATAGSRIEVLHYHQLEVLV